jgi:hypothetical protein
LIEKSVVKGMGHGTSIRLKYPLPENLSIALTTLSARQQSKNNSRYPNTKHTPKPMKEKQVAPNSDAGKKAR